jgi:membrane protease YdiL (CAAX protease family)
MLGGEKVEHNKSIIESLFNNLARVVCVVVLFLIFGIVTYRTLMNLNILNGSSIFGLQFYASVLQVIVIFMILKYCFKKENEIIKEDDKEFKTNLFDILIFLFIGLLLKNILMGGLHYFEIITNTVPKFSNDVVSDLLEGMKITNLDKIYSIMSGVILAPIVEELFFRKGVFEYFSDKEVTGRSVILISGISFGLTHLVGFAIPASAILTGIIFATIYGITKNIMYPIIGHCLNNLMPFITSIFRDNSGIGDVESYIEAGRIIEIKGAIIISLVLLIITSTISYTKRKTIISSDFKGQLRKVLTE